MLGVAETVVGQALALGKTPIDMLRGTGGEEKVLKNAKDACATEALEIATYTALERLARVVGDDRDRRAGGLDPRRRGEDARAHHARAARSSPTPSSRADVKGEQLLRHHRDRRRRRGPRGRPEGRRRPRKTTAKAKRTVRQARKVPGVARAEGQPRAPSPPRATWRSRATTRSPSRRSTAGSPSLSQIDLAKVDAYERKHQNRTTVIEPHLHPAGRRAVGRL